MTLVLDSRDVTMLAGDRAMINSWIKQGFWPPLIPADVLAECLTGDYRRNFHTDRLLRTCDVRNVTEVIARHAAYLRTRAGHDGAGGGVVLTSDRRSRSIGEPQPAPDPRGTDLTRSAGPLWSGHGDIPPRRTARRTR